jgi:pyruvate dehydrogenase E1 component beta subunit
VVAIAGAVQHADAAAAELADEGISCEVLDPRTLVPLDREAILASVSKTHHIVVVDPANRTCSAASEIAIIVCEEVFDSLHSAPRRVTTPDIPIPFSPPMEKPLYPNKDKIKEAVHAVLNGRKPTASIPA